jgi:alpha-methylacyl-CoA racemase
LLEGTDVCFAPVLSLAEAQAHPHNRARGVYIAVDGLQQPAPAPRFSATPPEVRAPSAALGEHTAQLLGDAGFSAEEIEALRASGTV